MKYFVPSILTATRAGAAIQTGTVIPAKMTPNFLDNATPRTLSTNGAYEADE
jgi:hypothetical protein